MSRNEVFGFLKDGNKVAEAVSVLLLIGFLLFAAGGAFAQSGSVYSERGSQTSSYVNRAVVLQTRIVKVETETPTRYAGAAAGAALGGALGVKLGHNSSAASTVLGLIGASIGGLGGAKAADALGGSRAIEYVVQVLRHDSTLGEVMAITQPDPAESISAGDAVFLINTVGTWRVVKMQGGLPQPVTQAPTRDSRIADPGVLLMGAQLSSRL
jgi:outer membrane lipoprotein SlyB